MNSVWTETVNALGKPRFPALKEDVKTDVAIVGGGIAGLLCSYKLKEAGIRHVLLEADEICGGITKNTTAKITFQHGLLYQDHLRKFGVEKAKLYLEANRAALNEYRKLCQKIDCDFEEKPSYVYSLSDSRKLEKELLALDKIGYAAKFVKALPLPFPVAGAVKFERQAQFHPLKFAYALAKDLPVFEHTKATDVFPNAVVANGCKVFAKKIVIATHFPFLNRYGFYFLKMFQHRSYVLALKNAPEVNGIYVDENEKGLSFRNHGKLLLLGGGSHRTGERGGNWQELTEFTNAHYPNASPVFQWATQDCITLDGVPYIGRYSKHAPNLYVTTGFNKWGMTSAMVAAQLLADEISEKRSPFASVFSPSRSIFHGRLFVNATKSAINLLTPTTPRCPHLGCALKYNPQERSWDCPCHGSRFTEEKKLIDNPSTKDLK